MRYQWNEGRDAESLREKGIEIEDLSIKFERGRNAARPSVSGYFRKYRASSEPGPKLGVAGDVWVDLSQHELYARTSREWVKWPGVNIPNADTKATWSEFEAHLLKYPVGSLGCSIPQSSVRYLWCNAQGVHWWTLDEISADRDKLLEGDPALRDNGRWILKRLVGDTETLVDSPGHTQDQDDDATAKRPIEAEVDESHSAQDPSTSRAPAKKKQRVARSSIINASRVLSAADEANPEESLERISGYIDALQSKLREARGEPDEGAASLKQRLEAVEAELEEARQQATKYETMYNDLNKHVDTLEEALVESRESARKHEQAAKDAQDRFSAIASARQQAAQILKRKS